MDQRFLSIRTIQSERIQQFDEKLRESENEKLILKGEIESLRWEMEQMRKSLREELLEIIYPNFVT